jgi:signal peptidase II
MQRYPRSRLAVYLLITSLGTAADLGSKSLVFDSMGGVFRRTDWLFDTAWVRFELHTSLNRGALWGLGQGWALWFAALSVVALVGINYWLFFRHAARSLMLTCCLALISAGTLGNLYDRLGLHGVSFPGEAGPARAVRDFLHFQFGSFDWAIFNFADCLLVVGSLLLFLTPSWPEPDTAQ